MTLVILSEETRSTNVQVDRAPNARGAGAAGGMVDLTARGADDLSASQQPASPKLSAVAGPASPKLSAVAGPASPELSAEAGRVDRREALTQRVEAISAIKRLQHVYGHYSELGLWQRLRGPYTSIAYPHGQISSHMASTPTPLEQLV